MKKVIIINGPIGVGKTTIGKLLCDKLNKSAFLDGDWCFDLHPFIANKETKDMAIDNIIHIIRNYLNCTQCNFVVFNWVMDKADVYKKIIDSIKSQDAYLYEITLTCTEKALEDRWYKDTLCGWRNDEWLNISKKSLNYFRGLNTLKIDTSNKNAANVTDEIYSMLM